MSLKKNPSMLSLPFIPPREIKKIKSGQHSRLYQCLGAHPKIINGKKGVCFAVWAPRAKNVSVVGDFNDWDYKRGRLSLPDPSSGIWQGFFPGAKDGDRYQYVIFSSFSRLGVVKIDPFGFYFSTPEDKRTVIYSKRFVWSDNAWISSRKKATSLDRPISIYELHLGSWKRSTDGNLLNYRDTAKELIPYIKELGYTHVEFLPLIEHPFYGSWGYQGLGYFAPTSRYGTPDDLKFLINEIHKAGIGVILDWVPGHFANDAHGLSCFDGKKLFEKKGSHPQWETLEFNFERFAVVDFLISSALFWIEEFHIDGLRVDAVASMLYLDFARNLGEWTPNFFGGRENLLAIAFLRKLNESIKSCHPDILIMAEESSAWPKVTQPTSKGGLQFDLKWNMGWMHDVLRYFSRKPNERYHFNHELEFCLQYAFDENFILAFSHDEVVHGKSSMLGKMHGDEAEKFENLKCLYGFMFAFPGKKLLFMGSELAPWNEWNHEIQLDWDFLKYDRHRAVYEWVKDLNKLYQKEKIFYKTDFNANSFKWSALKELPKGIIAFERILKPGQSIVVIMNVSTKAYKNVLVPVSGPGAYKEILNSRCQQYGGKSIINNNIIKTKKIARGRLSDCLAVYSAPLSIVFLKRHDG